MDRDQAERRDEKVVAHDGSGYGKFSRAIMGVIKSRQRTHTRSIGYETSHHRHLRWPLIEDCCQRRERRGRTTERRFN
jgi:hypothetical protein